MAVSAQGQNAIRKLNYAGEDILIRYGLEDTGVSGDVLEEDAKQVNSFVDICAAEDGLFYALDATFGRIFGYDAQGNLLFIYGGKNTGQTGTFEEAAALDVLDKWICVADAGTASITLFEKTEYAALVLEGIALYEEDKYPESIAVWEDVLQYNSHFILAYSKIGQALYQMGDYRQALSYFRQAADQPNYSRAFKEWRDEAVKSHFTLVACVLVGAILLLVVLCRAAARPAADLSSPKGRKRESLGYAFHVICHPLDGFWDLKYEKRGRAWVSTLFIILTVATFALGKSLTGFSLSKTVGQPLDWIYELKFVLVPLALFLVANVAITTLMEGKGTFRELYTAAGYTLLPLILIRIPGHPAEQYYDPGRKHVSASAQRPVGYLGGCVDFQRPFVHTRIYSRENGGHYSAHGGVHGDYLLYMRLVLLSVYRAGWVRIYHYGGAAVPLIDIGEE